MIKAIDTHCHVNYGPVDQLEPNRLTNLMKEDSCYTAYPDMLLKISQAAGNSFADCGLICLGNSDKIACEERLQEYTGSRYECAEPAGFPGSLLKRMINEILCDMEKEEGRMGPGISTKYAKVVFSVLAALIIIGVIFAVTK